MRGPRIEAYEVSSLGKLGECLEEVLVPSLGKILEKLCADRESNSAHLVFASTIHSTASCWVAGIVKNPLVVLIGNEIFYQ